MNSRWWSILLTKLQTSQSWGRQIPITYAEWGLGMFEKINVVWFKVQIMVVGEWVIDEWIYLGVKYMEMVEL